jgi:tRNA threonylcarbamoyladenosine biosynthesis protein TsaB
MGLILSIETATQTCSVAIHENGNVISNAEVHAERSHARFLTHLIGECARTAGISLEMLDAVAVSKGPGSYTGLRIGVSTAKGLCFALDKPLIVINTLEAMAYGLNQNNFQQALIVPMLDARRMEVYTSIFDANGACLLPTEAHILTETSFSEFTQTMILAGNGAAKCSGIFEDRKNIQIFKDIHPTAKNIGALAETYWQKKEFADLAYFEPYYLKDFVRFGK